MLLYDRLHAYWLAHSKIRVKTSRKCYNYEPQSSRELQRKVRLGTNKDNTCRRHLWNHGQAKKERRTATEEPRNLGTVSGKTTMGVHLLYSRDTSPFILMQLQITNISKRKYAYSNILNILQPKKEKNQIKSSDIFHTSAQNIDCG